MAQVVQTDKVINAKEGDLCIWWINYPPAPAERFVVDSREKAIENLLFLEYLYLCVESNVGGLSIFEDGEWVDWYDDDGNDIDYYVDLTRPE